MNFDLGAQIRFADGFIVQYETADNAIEAVMANINKFTNNLNGDDDSQVYKISFYCSRPGHPGVFDTHNSLIARFMNNDDPYECEVETITNEGSHYETLTWGEVQRRVLG
jgi:hypothetical protein